MMTIEEFLDDYIGIELRYLGDGCSGYLSLKSAINNSGGYCYNCVKFCQEEGCFLESYIDLRQEIGTGIKELRSIARSRFVYRCI